MSDIPASTKAFRLHALGIVAAVIVLVALYLVIGSALHIGPLYAGFFFLLYWASMRLMSATEFLPALLGALGGLGMGWLLHAAPALVGTAGLVSVLVLICIAIYFQVRGEFALLVNPGFMLFLTLATVPPVAKQEDFIGMASAILYAAAFFGGLFFLARMIAERRKSKLVQAK